MKERILAIFLAFVMVFALYGCDERPKKLDTSSPAVGENAANPTDSDDDVTANDTVNVPDQGEPDPEPEPEDEEPF